MVLVPPFVLPPSLPGKEATGRWRKEYGRKEDESKIFLFSHILFSIFCHQSFSSTRVYAGRRKSKAAPIGDPCVRSIGHLESNHVKTREHSLRGSVDARHA